ncbi:UNVERIFIED_CONTAM: hypothetical protein Slati_2243500 [Sesamum latifolium]|uniref:Uncharacterized protein n=1 Tax=Sesamum latifolium TaxID=2727402 RepID=A0AAW2WUU6_9LAMI
MEIDLAFSELHGTSKLDGQNYAMWHRKIQYFLHHKKILDHLTTSMAELIQRENRPTAQYRREIDAYNKWLEQDMSACFTMLSCMHDNLIRMIRELQNASCELNDEQQVLDVLRSLPEHTWGHVKLVLMQNEQIKTFDSVSSHLKLEADCRESGRAQQATFVAHAGQHKPHKGKRWNKPTGARQVKAKAKSRTWPHKIQAQQKHVTRDRAVFVEYHRVPACNHYIAMGNGAQEEVSWDWLIPIQAQHWA